MADLASLNSLLFDAIQKNNIYDVRHVLQAGADINARWWLHDLTPLMISITKKYFELAKILIEKGADVNLQTYHGNTALHYVVHHKNNDIINILLNKGAKKDIQNISRHTPYTLDKFIEDWKEIQIKQSRS